MQTIQFYGTALFICCMLVLGCNENPVNEADPFDAFSSDGNPLLKMSYETESVFGQGPGGPVVEGGEATLRRTPNGISVKVSLPTPVPGTYNYPENAEEGHPEAFTLWVFVFDDPESDNWTGAFLGAGHVVGGPHLNLSGTVSRNTEPFLGDHLGNPAEAEIHLAVAPHGQVDPDKLPDQIKTPSGSPEHWWFAIFE